MKLPISTWVYKREYSQVPDSKPHILVLFHENATRLSIQSSGVYSMANSWRRQGCRVTFQFGPKDRVPADLIFVHVDLSVVPEEYLDYASGYPRAVNGDVRDIRKSTVSEQLIKETSNWPGPVIVKTDLNHGGHPEFLLGDGSGSFTGILSRKIRSMVSRNRQIATRTYRVHQNRHQVPKAVWNRPDLVVERFCPELNDGRYHVRMYRFLGTCGTCRRASSTHPIVKSQTTEGFEYVEPDPKVFHWKDKFKLDYGKLDYVVHRGEAVLIDVNKTPGIGRKLGLPQAVYFSKARQRDEIRARGIFEFLD